MEKKESTVEKERRKGGAGREPVPLLCWSAAVSVEGLLGLRKRSLLTARAILESVQYVEQVLKS